jgi:hypothetical protein
MISFASNLHPPSQMLPGVALADNEFDELYEGDFSLRLELVEKLVE